MHTLLKASSYYNYFSASREGVVPAHSGEGVWCQRGGCGASREGVWCQRRGLVAPAERARGAQKKRTCGASGEGVVPAERAHSASGEGL